MAFHRDDRLCRAANEERLCRHQPLGQTEHIPTGYFLLISGITGIASALAIAAMRCIAEAQIVPIESVFWGANLATGVVFGVTIFVAVFGALCLAFFEAKQRRAKIEAELDCPDDL